MPGYNDTGWGANTGNVLTQYLSAIADVTLQLSGGAFTLTADADFGANFGLKALYLISETANPASAGVLRLAKTDAVKWRNNANGADLTLAIDGSDNLQFAATKVLLSGAVVNADINAAAAIAYTKLALSNSIVNADINSAAAIAYSKLNLSTSVVNADIAAAAAIALTKLASTTAYFWYVANSAGVLTPLGMSAGVAVQTDSNGRPNSSSVTTTELSYVSGVTSAIQTQLNARVANPLIADLAAGSHKITGLASATASGDAVAYGQSAAALTSPVLTTPSLGVASATSINFGGTALSVYAEGTWTPSDQSGAGLSFTVTSALYTKIGRVVYVELFLAYPATASGASAVIGGLPFTVGSYGTAMVSSNAAVNAVARFGQGTANVSLLTPNGAAGVTNVALSSSQVFFSGFYFV